MKYPPCSFFARYGRSTEATKEDSYRGRMAWKGSKSVAAASIFFGKYTASSMFNSGTLEHFKLKAKSAATVNARASEGFIRTFRSSVFALDVEKNLSENEIFELCSVSSDLDGDFVNTIFELCSVSTDLDGENAPFAPMFQNWPNWRK